MSLCVVGCVGLLCVCVCVSESVTFYGDNVGFQTIQCLWFSFRISSKCNKYGILIKILS